MLVRMRLARKFMISSGKLDAHDLRLLVQNGQAHFDVGRLQVRDQTPFEAGDQPVLEILNFAGRADRR